jgi:hypothetical protein
MEMTFHEVALKMHFQFMRFRLSTASGRLEIEVKELRTAPRKAEVREGCGHGDVAIRRMEISGCRVSLKHRNAEAMEFS